MNEYVIRNQDQLSRLKPYLDKFDFPFQIKISKVGAPKTWKQIKYAHSLCNALALYKQTTPEAAKRDSKVAFGTVTICASIVTGDRTVRLKSFADYSKEEMCAFVLGMHTHLDENKIPYVRATE